MRAANEEKWAHIDELGALVSKMPDYRGAVTIVQGTKDILVPWENATRAEQSLSGSDFKLVLLKGENHFLPWSQEDLVAEEIVAMADKVPVSGLVVAQ